MQNIDWALLRSLLEVVVTGSLSAAATRVATTRPTFSRHIRKLERVLGVNLFRRSVRGSARRRRRLGLLTPPAPWAPPPET